MHMSDISKSNEPFVTKEKVFSVCNDLALLGEEPSVSKVFKRIGHRGSRDTINRYLKDWRSKHGLLEYKQPPPVPDTIQASFDQFAQLVWAMCHRETSELSDRVIDRLQSENEMLQSELDEAFAKLEDRDGLLKQIGSLEEQIKALKSKSADKPSKATTRSERETIGELDLFAEPPARVAPERKGNGSVIE